MSLSKRIAQSVPHPTNNGCRTCTYLTRLSREDRTAFDDWVAGGHSITQLWEICSSETPPLNISISGFRNHIRHHQRV